MALAIDTYPRWTTELAVAIALLTKLTEKIAFLVEFLHAEVSRVRGKDFVVLCHGHMPRAVKLAVGISVASEVHNRLAFGVEDVNSVVVSISDDDSAFGIQSEAAGSFELTQPSPLGTELTNELTLACVDLGNGKNVTS